LKSQRVPLGIILTTMTRPCRRKSPLVKPKTPRCSIPLPCTAEGVGTCKVAVKKCDFGVWYSGRSNYVTIWQMGTEKKKGRKMVDGVVCQRGELRPEFSAFRSRSRYCELLLRSSRQSELQEELHFDCKVTTIPTVSSRATAYQQTSAGNHRMCSPGQDLLFQHDWKLASVPPKRHRLGQKSLRTEILVPSATDQH
jgi:hypothetical protein